MLLFLWANDYCRRILGNGPVPHEGEQNLQITPNSTHLRNRNLLFPLPSPLLQNTEDHYPRPATPIFFQLTTGTPLEWWTTTSQQGGPPSTGSPPERTSTTHWLPSCSPALYLFCRFAHVCSISWDFYRVVVSAIESMFYCFITAEVSQCFTMLPNQ